jgi:hypothetical protein
MYTEYVTSMWKVGDYGRSCPVNRIAQPRFASQAQWTFETPTDMSRWGLCPLFLFLARATHLRVAGDVFWQELDGDEAMQAGVFGLVDDSHATA